jgi:integrase
MKNKLPRDILREFLGHRSGKMTEHYDNPILLERLIELQNMRSNVEQFWSNGTDEKKIIDFKVS